MVLDKNIPGQHPSERIHCDVARNSFALVELLLVLDGFCPGAAIDGHVPHTCLRHLAAAPVDALGILAARHLQTVGRARELHCLHGACVDVLENDRPPAEQIGRTWKNFQRRDATIDQRTTKAGILRPHAMFGPDFRAHRRCGLVAVRQRVNRRRRINTEV